MGRVVILGSINTDLVAQVDRLPRPGETVLGDAFAVHGGGKGANQALAAARAGGAVTMVACLGGDDFGAARLADLAGAGVDVAGVRRLAGVASGVALIGVDPAGQNLIMVASGANARVDEAMAAALPCAPGDVLLTQLELPLPAVAAGLAAARRAGARTLLNAAPSVAGAASLLAMVDLLIVNEIEAADLLGGAAESDAATAAALAALGPRAVVVTLGARGALVWEAGAGTAVPAPAVTPVDTTGAGDAFCGVLAAGLAGGLSLLAAARRGAVAGGLATTRPGAQGSLPTLAEIEAALPALAPDRA